MTDTVFAPATPPARSAIAVVRVSGPDAAGAVRALAGRLPEPRRASLRRLRHEGVQIDQGLVLWTPGPASFTGEDAAEFYVHGGPAVVAALSRALSELGLRAAEPGEFTRRAFENGKLDLAEAEGLADLIDAETEAQRAQALEQLGGALGRRHDAWRELAVEALAHLEAAVDFPDEDLPEDVASRAAAPLARLREEIAGALEASPRGEVVRDGYRVALLGAPNAGKSTLLNALAGRDAAIVTPIPGTTRDIIEVPITLEGFRVILADTAGLRDTDDLVEAEGVRRARAWAETAHLRLWVTAPGDAETPPIELKPGDLRILSKQDLQARRAGPNEIAAAVPGGVDALRTALSTAVRSAAVGADFPAITRERHRLALAEASSHLQRAGDALLEPELAAEDVRLALRALERISGRVTSEEVLGRIFSTFCIGK